MSLIDILLGKNAITKTPCGGFGCKNLVPVDLSKAQPDIHICKRCESRINQGIVQSVHAYTGKLTGSYNIFDRRIGVV